jgi:hypothetical protein
MGFCGAWAGRVGQRRAAIRIRDVIGVRKDRLMLCNRRKEAFYRVATRAYALDGKEE